MVCFGRPVFRGKLMTLHFGLRVDHLSIWLWAGCSFDAEGVLASPACWGGCGD
jgi:hypothetical protein